MKEPRKRLINEIFHSLQGEGRHTGVSSVFVRFSGCNLRCPFCDTDHQSGRWMTDGEIIAEIMKYPADWVILTGGEPGLSIDEELIGRVHKETGKKVAIETNGTCPLPDTFDWVTLSPKTGISGRQAIGTDGRPLDSIRLMRADEIKVVDIGQDLEPYFNLQCRSESTLMYLQPCFVEDPEQRKRNTERTVARVMNDPRWTLSLQTHRLLNIQ